MTETQGSDEFGAGPGGEYAAAPEPAESQGESSPDPTEPGPPAPADLDIPDEPLFPAGDDLTGGDRPEPAGGVDQPVAVDEWASVDRDASEEPVDSAGADPAGSGELEAVGGNLGVPEEPFAAAADGVNEPDSVDERSWGEAEPMAWSRVEDTAELSAVEDVDGAEDGEPAEDSEPAADAEGSGDLEAAGDELGVPEEPFAAADDGVNQPDSVDVGSSFEAEPVAWSRVEETPDSSAVAEPEAPDDLAGDDWPEPAGADADGGVDQQVAVDEGSSVEPEAVAWSRVEDTADLSAVAEPEAPGLADLDTSGELADSAGADPAGSGELEAAGGELDVPEEPFAAADGDVHQPVAVDEGSSVEPEPVAWSRVEDSADLSAVEASEPAAADADTEDAEPAADADAEPVADAAAEVDAAADVDAGAEVDGELAALEASLQVVDADAGAHDADTGDQANDDHADAGDQVDDRAGASIAMPAPPYTGERRVDEAVAALQHLADRPTEEHVSAYDATHNGLQDVLADLDRDPDGS